MNLQDMFLNQIRKEKIIVTVHLINGVVIQGTIKGFDSFSIFLKNDHQELIYKHAIVSIVPQKEVQALKEQDEKSSISEIKSVLQS
ncbi:MAG: RNA chaperone Hfq [Nitrospirae bacterium]|nr:RNA chaperone Hfq [Nitrospirota bacterium]MBI3593326.1 RNA chaperone Hfq [Nitrospirota bacterium]